MMNFIVPADRRAARLARRRARRLARRPPFVPISEQVRKPVGFNPGTGKILQQNFILADSYRLMAHTANLVAFRQWRRDLPDMRSWGLQTRAMWRTLQQMRKDTLVMIKSLGVDALPMPRALSDRLKSILGKEEVRDVGQEE